MELVVLTFLFYLQILKEISTLFPFFKGNYKGWRDSVRHNLSSYDCFVKVCSLYYIYLYTVQSAVHYPELRFTLFNQCRSELRGLWIEASNVF